MQNVRREVFEISSSDKVLLRLQQDERKQFIIKPKLRNLIRGGKIYKEIKWQNQYQTIYNSFNEIEHNINLILETEFSDPDNKILQSWLGQLQQLLPKVKQAKKECLNKSWTWLDMDWGIH